MRAAPLVAVACTTGPVDVTRITDTRVVAVIAEPPEAAVGETVAVDVVAVEPDGRAATVRIWQCPDDGDCVTLVAPLVGDRVPFAWAVSGDEALWALACRIPACEAPTDRDLRDPDAYLRRLPLDGVSLARTRVPATDAEVAERRTNPVIAGAAVPDRVAVGDEVAVDVETVGATGVAPLATAGSFGATLTDVDADGLAALRWFAPARPGPAALYVVAQDGLGGAAVERLDTRVE